MRQILRFLVIAMLAVNAGVAFGQGSTTASMTGKIQDEKSLGVPGATVLAVHTPTGSEYGTVTNIDGTYRIVNMQVGGPYRLKISFVGYQSIEKSNIMLSLGQTLKINATLKEATTELDEVVVTANADLIDGEKTGATTVIGEKEIDNLPTASRNLTDFLRLTPQANIQETGDGPSISIAGQNNRFNSVFIDGAVSNDVFGLSGSGTNGGQTGISPISIDAIEQFQVTVSPYDVSLGNFTGGGVNAVTRSGSNTFSGSAYYFFRNQNLAGKTPTEDDDVERIRKNDFDANTFGFRLGGPIVKDKVFFFVNAEFQNDTESQPFNINEFDGVNTGIAEINTLRDNLRTRFGYETGGFEDNAIERKGRKYLGKIDWNINRNHRLSVRHSYSYAEELEAATSSNTDINFVNNSEFFPSTTNSTTLELKSNFSQNASNKLILGYTRVKDDRGVSGNPFPRVTVFDTTSSGRTVDINFGSKPFSVGNVLEQETFILTNNFTLFSGNHTFTFGTHNEFYSIYNLFLRENYGVYQYETLDDFLNDAGPSAYIRTYALLPTVDAAQGDDATEIAGEFNAAQLGFYIQDEIQVSEKLKISAGIRADIPFFTDDPATNEVFNEEALPAMDLLYDTHDAQSGQSPNGQVLFSPRVGFNYDISGDQKFQIRGGIGIFTGRSPFVWPGGSYTNNGVFLASVDDFRGPRTVIGSDTVGLPFRGNPNNQYISTDIVGAGVNRSQIDLFAEDFKFPQVLRTSLAVDKNLPWGMVGTFEAIYTKNINAISYQNINVQKPTAFVNDPSQRPVYNGQRVDNRFDRVLLASNVNEGYSYNFTAQFQKPFNNGFTANIAYTFGRSKVLFDATSSQNSSNWRNVEALDKNELELGFSSFDVGSRVTAFVSYQFDWKKIGFDNASTTLALFYNGQSGDRFSYTYNRAASSAPGGIRSIGGNDLAGRDFNQLFYIPNSIDEINLVQDGDRTPQQQWEDLNAYIEDDPYLKNNRGQVAERNAGRLPFENILDLKFVQEFRVKSGDTDNRIQLTFDIFNFTNFLNKEWGRRRNIDFGNYSFVNFRGFVDPDNGDYTPQFTYNGPTDRDALKEEVSDLDDFGIRSSRWQGQIGIRYIFN